MPKPVALIIDDNPSDIDLISGQINSEYRVMSTTDPERALAILSEKVPDIVLLDLSFPGRASGLDTLGKIREREPNVPVIMVTESRSTGDAVDCIKAGAFHFVEKLELAALPNLMSKALDQRHHHRVVSTTREQIRESVGEIVGESAPIKRMLERIDQVAPTDAPVLVVGESGSGKELVAWRIHDRSNRRDGPMVVVACPAIPSTLTESKFFGTEAHAYTGAISQEGRFELANGGTIFLDEIADIELSLQPKLLRVLQDGAFERVGGKATIQVDVRVVSASSRDLRKMVEDGSFRRELFYRLNTVVVEVPPLRERGDDIPLLVRHFVARCATRLRRPEPEVTDAAIARLQACDWRGNNVRELRSCVEAALIGSRGDVLDEFDFLVPNEDTGGGPQSGGYRDAVADFQRGYLAALLEKHRGSVTKVARDAGLSTRAVYDMLKKLGIDQKSYRDP